MGHAAEAIRLFRAALSADPKRSETWQAIAELMEAAGNPSDAAAAWTRAAECAPADTTPWLRLADLHRDRGQPEAAAHAIRRARQRAPHRPELARLEVEALRDAGLAEKAHNTLLQAIQQHPGSVDLHLMAAEDYADLGRRDDCLRHMDCAVAADPHHTIARSRRANYYVQSRRLDDAEADITVILAHTPDSPHARLQAARVALLRGELDRSRAMLDALLDADLPLTPANRGHALLYRAEIHGKQGRLAEEWADLTHGQATLAQPQLDRGEDGSRYLQTVARRTAILTPGSAFRRAVESMPTQPPAGSALEDHPPVFMFGFPRSGTTLAERILGAHPALTATDELNLLGAVFDSIVKDCNSAYTEALSDAQVRHLRQVFANKAVRAGFDPRRTRLIDKNPLNFVFIDIVRRVFPDAPVLMILRDPRDCVWSAFRQAFEPNPALVMSRSLHHTATLYRAVLDLWQVGRTLPGMALTEVHYEHLVEDFEAGARQLVAAAGEPWDDAVLQFHRTLGNAFVRTPSFAAVGQKVNRRRLGRWKRHANMMSEVTDILAPYVDTLGVQAVAPSLME